MLKAGTGEGEGLPRRLREMLKEKGELRKEREEREREVKELRRRVDEHQRSREEVPEIPERYRTRVREAATRAPAALAGAAPARAVAGRSRDERDSGGSIISNNNPPEAEWMRSVGDDAADMVARVDAYEQRLLPERRPSYAPPDAGDATPPPPETEKKDALAAALFADVNAAQLSRCSGCKTWAAKLHYCAGCGIMRYCSRACQKKHWKEEHKKWVFSRCTRKMR